MIKVEHLKKSFHKKLAVNDISFTVDTGKVTGFLGPNGAGKSTTMRLMLGLDSGEGHTTYDGRDLHKYKKPSEIVGVLLEAKAYHPTRRADRHLKILATAGGIPKNRVSEVLDLVGLNGVAKKGPGKFSLGMSQRLGIAAAILGSPKYLILDEPSNGLDPEGIVWLRQFLKDYADKGNAVFVSSHLLSEMSQMVDDVVVIGRGKLLANTSIGELISGNTRSSVFVRSTNLPHLARIFERASLKYEKSGNGINVTGASTDKIGSMAFAARIPILELAKQSASLEQAFLEITEGSEEYLSTTKSKAKKS